MSSKKIDITGSAETVSQQKETLQMPSLIDRSQAHRALRIEAECDRIAWGLGYNVPNPEVREPAPAFQEDETGVYKRPIHLQNRGRASLELCSHSAA